MRIIRFFFQFCCLYRGRNLVGQGLQGGAENLLKTGCLEEEEKKKKKAGPIRDANKGVNLANPAQAGRWRSGELKAVWFSILQ